jgi:hypothetical protein
MDLRQMRRFKVLLEAHQHELRMSIQHQRQYARNADPEPDVVDKATSTSQNNYSSREATKKRAYFAWSKRQLAALKTGVSDGAYLAARKLTKSDSALFHGRATAFIVRKTSSGETNQPLSVLLWRAVVRGFLTSDGTRTGTSEIDLCYRANARGVPYPLSGCPLLDKRDHIHSKLGANARVSQGTVGYFSRRLHSELERMAHECDGCGW